jgi:simple sugar transport system ATP-binding protein
VVSSQGTAVASQLALEVLRLAKSYGAIRAVNNVSFGLPVGSITALVGDNGAGKSTVVKMLSGAVRPDAGIVKVRGARVRITDSVGARHLGIETVHQDLALLPNLSVAANLFLGREIMRRGVWGILGQLDRQAMRQQASRMLSELQIRLPSLETPTGLLSGGQRQSIAVARAVGFASTVLLMDEPTAALGVAQSAAVLTLARAAADQGLAVLIISHIIPQVLELADTILVLRHGRLVGRVERNEADHELLVRLIVGLENSFGVADENTEDDQ